MMEDGRGMVTEVLTFGMVGMPSEAQMVSVAFSPVVTMARRWGN